MNFTAAQHLSVYDAATLRQWAVEFADGVIEAVWASSKNQARAIAAEKRLALIGERVAITHTFRM